MRRDALARWQASKMEKKPLEDAVNTIKKICLTVETGGLLALEEEIDNIESEFLKLLVTMTVDMWSPELMIEIATNIYWTDEPEGVQAMVYYIYLKGILLQIQESFFSPKYIGECLQYLYEARYMGEWFY